MFWQVLGPGGAKEPIEILSDFLGREPSIQAFVESNAEYSMWCETIWLLFLSAPFSAITR